VPDGLVGCAQAEQGGGQVGGVRAHVAGQPVGGGENLPARVRRELDRAAGEVEPGRGDRLEADAAAQRLYRARAL
jgi:hypothetical protein